jgi:hypothetical protein
VPHVGWVKGTSRRKLRPAGAVAGTGIAMGWRAGPRRPALHAVPQSLRIQGFDGRHWARIQRDLGLALRNALTVYTPEAFKDEHAGTQVSLAAAHRDLAALEAPPPAPPKRRRKRS